jgi:hypothetical protein
MLNMNDEMAHKELSNCLQITDLRILGPFYIK